MQAHKGKDEFDLPTAKARRSIAAQMIEQINDELSNGARLETYPEEKRQGSTYNFQDYRLMNAFNFVEEYKLTIHFPFLILLPKVSLTQYVSDNPRNWCRH